MNGFLSRFGHGLTALPAVAAFLLGRAGALSSQMTTIISVLTVLFGAAHVAAILHSAAVAKVASVAEQAAKGAAASGQLVAALSDLAKQFIASAPGGGASSAASTTGGAPPAR